MDTVQYEHHGELVFANAEYVGQHRQICLCYACNKFHPNQGVNCPIAQELYQVDVKYNLVTPVLECAVFGYKE
jgi:hypothetical protein